MIEDILVLSVIGFFVYSGIKGFELGIKGRSKNDYWCNLAPHFVLSNRIGLYFYKKGIVVTK